MRGGLESSYQESLVKRRRHGRIEDIKGQCLDEGGTIPQNARRNSVKMYRAQKGPKKAERSAQQNLWVLWQDQLAESGFLLAKYG